MQACYGWIDMALVFLGRTRMTTYGEHKTVTAMGHLILKHPPAIPFMMMIAPEQGA